MKKLLAVCGSALRRWVLVALMVAGAPSGFANTPQIAEEIETLVTNFMAANHIPGLSIGVSKDGNVALARGYGSANLDTGTTASETTIYPLASLTKQFTATGIVMLVQQGELSLDDAVGNRLDGAPGSWQAITIRQLLNHTAGIPVIGATENFARLSTRHHAPREILGWILVRSKRANTSAVDGSHFRAQCHEDSFFRVDAQDV
jgi:CubicO group peptidase (beta-lactamase class C family)